MSDEKNEMDDLFELEFNKSVGFNKKEPRSSSNAAKQLLSFLENVDKFLSEPVEKNISSKKIAREEEENTEKFKQEEQKYEKQIKIETTDISSDKSDKKDNHMSPENWRVTETSNEDYSEQMNQEDEQKYEKQVEVESKDIFSIEKKQQMPIEKERVYETNVQSKSEMKIGLPDKKSTQSKDSVKEDDHERVRNKIVSFLEKKAVDQGKLKKVVPVLFNKERKG